jgi:hypothetical protein
VNDGGLRQRQTVAMLGLDHFGTPLSLIVRPVYGAALAKIWTHFSACTADPELAP